MGRKKNTPEQAEAAKERARERQKAWYAALTQEEKAKIINRARQWQLDHSEYCKGQERRRRSNNLPKTVFDQVKKRAIAKGKDFNITVEWITEKMKNGCEATGRAFERLGGAATINSPSIDRIDNSKGYTMDNCRMVVWGWNAACGPWGEDALLKMFKDRERNIRVNFLRRKK